MGQDSEEKTMQHTPGPWRSNDTNVFQDNAVGSVVMIASCGGSALPYEERKANARLIAAALETAAERDKLKESNAHLLATLRQFTRQFTSRIERRETRIEQSYHQMKAAIREADGEPEVETTKKPITPGEFVAQIREFQNKHDAEEGHMKADDLMCSLLETMGYGQGVEAFRDMYKWYA